MLSVERTQKHIQKRGFHIPLRYASSFYIYLCLSSLNLLGIFVSVVSPFLTNTGGFHCCKQKFLKPELVREAKRFS